MRTLNNTGLIELLAAAMFILAAYLLVTALVEYFRLIQPTTDRAPLEKADWRLYWRKLAMFIGVVAAMLALLLSRGS